MVSAFALAKATVGNYFTADKSVLAGGGASVLTVAVGAILVAAGVAIPPIAILGIHAAIPLTMPMFLAAAAPIGHFVTAYVSPTLNESINALAKKIGVGAEHLKSFIPEVQASYPSQKDGSFAPAPIATSNLNQL